MIRKHLIEGRLTKQEIAAIVDCGIVTVYRFEGFVYNHFIVYAAGEQSPGNVFATLRPPPRSKAVLPDFGMHHFVSLASTIWQQ